MMEWMLPIINLGSDGWLAIYSPSVCVTRFEVRVDLMTWDSGERLYGWSLGAYCKMQPWAKLSLSEHLPVWRCVKIGFVSLL